MPLDERVSETFGFFSDYVKGSPLPQAVIEEGDVAELHDKGSLIMARIIAIRGDEIVGLITSSEYDYDPNLEYVSGKEIHFSEKNIFAISDKKGQI